MADDLIESIERRRAERAATRIDPEVSTQTPLSRAQGGVLGLTGERVLFALLLAALALAAWLGWRAFFYEEEGDPVGSAMMAFEKQNALTVFSSRFEVVAESQNTQRVAGIPVLKSRQAAIIPASVEYRIDLSQVDRDRMAWDEATKTLDVTLPRLTTTKPNLNEAEARVFDEGVFISRGAARNLAKSNSEQAERKASQFAKNPEVLALARSAARDAVRQNLAIPMQVAGYGDVTVNVRFDGEPKR